MLETLRYIPFRAKEVWFADMPYEVGGCELLEFRDCKRKVNISIFKRSEAQTLVIDLTQDLDTIWQKFDKKSCRYEIKRAEREGIVINWTDNVGPFLDLNARFRGYKRLGRGMPNSYIARYGHILVATLNNQLLAGHVYLEDAVTMRWLIGASVPPTPIISAANRALTSWAIQFAKAKGLKEFDFGGYNEQAHPSISFFKKSFGGELTTRYNYSKWCIPPVVTDTARRLNEKLHGLDFSISESDVEGHHSSPSGDRYLEDCLREIGITENDSILDVGCGKGSAMLAMLKFPFARVDGLELSDNLVRIARKNLRRTNCKVMEGDARFFSGYRRYNVIYLYNPFPESVMSDVIHRIILSLLWNDKKVTLIYNNPTCHKAVIATNVFHKVNEYPNRWGTGIYVYTN